MNGMSLHFVAQRTGVNRGTIRSLLSRHPELQEMPYSTKAGGARVYLPAFVEWLAGHEGAPVAKVAVPATNATGRPSGALAREYRLIYGPEEASKRLDFLIGYKPAPALPAPSDADRFGFAAELSAETGIPPAIIRKAESAAAATAQAVIRRELDKASTDREQGRLGL